MLKVITVCGMGVGSSLIMKMTAQAVFDELGVKAQIEHWDMGTVSGKPCDFIITAEEFRKQFAGQDNVIYVRNFVDKNEMKAAVSAYLDAQGIK